MRKLIEKRWGLALFFILMSGVSSFIIGGLMSGGFVSLIEDRSFFEAFWDTTVIFYKCFFAGMTVSGLLLLLTKVHKNYALHFGYGLYYGTVVVSVALQAFCHLRKLEARLLGFIIAALACLVIWYAVIKPYFIRD